MIKRISPITICFFIFLSVIWCTQSANGFSALNSSQNSSIDETWYNPKIEMLIITPDRTDFIDAVKPLMEWKNTKGVKTIILSNYSLYEGVDDAEKIRNMIKSYYETENVQWVLLAGDAGNSTDELPMRYVYNPDLVRWGGGKTETVGGEYFKPTDYYYADLNGSWDSDGDGRWGEAPQDNTQGKDEISWIPEVYVGRLPADNALELEIMVNKTIKYETNPEVGDWMNRMLLAGGILSYTPQEYESRLTGFIIENYTKSDLMCTHLAEEAGNLTRNYLSNNFSYGYSTVLMAGHGLPTSYYRNPSQVGFTTSDANTCSNIHNPSLVYLDACSTSSYDFNDNNIGETLIKRINSGAIGAIGGLRATWNFENDTNLEKVNRGNAKLFWREFFLNKKFQQGKALYDSKVAYMNSDYYTYGIGSTSLDIERKNLLTYCLLGDPEVDVYTNKSRPILNPFSEDVYEGQIISTTIKDINGINVSYARVHLETSDGIYYTVYANEKGNVNFRIPALPNEVYNVTITGHNIIPLKLNIIALALPRSNSIFIISFIIIIAFIGISVFVFYWYFSHKRKENINLA